MIVKRLAIVIVCSTLLLISGCGGSQTPVKTEPETKSATQTQPEKPPQNTPDQTLERFPDSEEENRTATETTPEPEPESQKKVQSTETENHRTETSPEKSPGFTPISHEKIPVISPLQEDKTKVLADSLSGGITGIFRGFGYTGKIEVPENFKRRVAHYIRYFSENPKGSRFYVRAMTRGKKYLPMIRKVLKRKRLPVSLAYLPLIESGFNPHARSRAHAVGLWQFMRGTARMYGLTVNRHLDQRRDPEKSTAAAAEYLNDLLAMFGAEDPFLGICAYNCGEGKILRSLRKISYTERSFWTLVRKNLLPNETDQYIPRILAVILMANEPDKYLAASKLIPANLINENSESEDLEVINALKSSKDNLVADDDTDGDNQPEPVKTVEQPTQKQLKTAKPASRSNPPVVRYRVKRGDTLYSIAKAHQVYVKNLKKWNGLRSNRIKAGRRLVIYTTQSASASGGSNNLRSSGKRGYRLVYTVNYTDSLARIALFFRGVSSRDIMGWNRLRHTRIHPRQKLTIYLDKRPRKILTHTVKRGETAGKIARKYNLRIEYVLSLNGLVTNSRLKPGKRLKIYYF